MGLADQAFVEQRCLKDGNADQNVRRVGAALVGGAIAVMQASSIPVDEESGMAISSAFSNSSIWTQRGAEAASFWNCYDSLSDRRVGRHWALPEP